MSSKVRAVGIAVYGGLSNVTPTASSFEFVKSTIDGVLFTSIWLPPRSAGPPPFRYLLLIFDSGNILLGLIAASLPFCLFLLLFKLTMLTLRLNVAPTVPFLFFSSSIIFLASSTESTRPVFCFSSRIRLWISARLLRSSRVGLALATSLIDECLGDSLTEFRIGVLYLCS